MRRIETSEEKEARQKRKSMFISLALLFILVISTLGYAFLSFQENNNGSGNKNLNSTQPQTSDMRWLLEYKGKQMSLVSSKESVSDIPVDIFLDINNYQNNQIYIDSENNSGIFYELALNFEIYTSKRPAPACYGSCEENIPEKNCSSFLIVYNKSDENKVYQKDNCVFIEGDIRAADAFIYKLFDTI